MSVSIPQPFRTRIEGPIGPVTVGGIPDTFHINVDSLPVIHTAIDSLPVIHLSIDNIPKIQLGVDPVEIRLTEFPSIRGHLPADFAVGFSVLGMELATIRLCGEAQIITEPYDPNPCEVCGPPGQLLPADVIRPAETAQPAPPAKAEPASEESKATVGKPKATARRRKKG